MGRHRASPRATAAIELNASTDNPLVFDNGDVLSGGNFHGQPVAQALDFLAIGLTTLQAIAERRVERLVNPDLSQGLPAFLTADPGLSSGYMMVQITAASLVAESRTLAYPASIGSIPTDANQEDFVPMGMGAAYKARRILRQRGARRRDRAALRRAGARAPAAAHARDAASAGSTSGSADCGRRCRRWRRTARRRPISSGSRGPSARASSIPPRSPSLLPPSRLHIFRRCLAHKSKSCRRFPPSLAEPE